MTGHVNGTLARLLLSSSALRSPGHLARKTFGVAILAGSLSIGASGVARAEPLQWSMSGGKWKPYIELSEKFSEDRGVGEVRLFAPFASNNDTLAFLDIRGSFDNNSSTEGNFGVGLRHIIDDKYIVGGYVFYDRRKSESENKFNQFTFGAEILGGRWDLRANYYAAEDDWQTLTTDTRTLTSTDVVTTGSGSSGVPYLEAHNIWLSGGTLVTTTTNTTTFTTEARERALDGYDFEAGYEVFDRVHVYGGYYNFSGGDIEIDGFRGRAEFDILDPVRFPRVGLTLTAEATDDDYRGSVGWFGLRFRFNFGADGLLRESKLSKLETRMLTRIQRDPDVVIGTDANTTSTTSSVVTTEGGTGDGVATALLPDGVELFYVDNTVAGGGDGTYENPFNSAADIPGATNEDDIIFIYAGDGTSTGLDTGLALQDGQHLIGEFMGLTWDGTQLIAQGGMPVMSSAGAAVIVLATNNEVSGLTLDGGGVAIRGLYGQDVVGTYVFQDLSILDVAEQGIAFSNSALTGNLDVTIQGTTINGTGREGILMANWGPTGSGVDQITFTMDDVFVTNSGERVQSEAIGLSSDGLLKVVISDSTVSDSQGRGLLFYSETDLDTTITGSTIRNNIRDGMVLESQGDLMIVVDDNVITGNGSGIEVGHGWDAIATITNNTLTDNTGSGIEIQGWQDGSSQTLTITGNDLSRNTGNNVYIATYDSDAGITATISNNTISDSANDALTVFTFGPTSPMDVTMNGNTINNTGGYGATFNTYDAGSHLTIFMNDNIVVGSGSGGIYLAAYGGGTLDITMTGNTAADSGRWGVLLDAENGGTLDLSGGGNRFFNNNLLGGARDADLVAGLVSVVNAQNVWWGCPAGPMTGQLLTSGTATIDATNPLATDPDSSAGGTPLTCP